MLLDLSYPRILQATGAGLSLAILTPQALGAVSTYGDRVSWASAAGVSAFVTEGFESASIGELTGTPFASGLLVSTTHPYARVSNTPNYSWNVVNTTAGGTNFLHLGDSTEVASGGGSALTSFTIPTLTNAFGFDIGGMQYPPFLVTLLNGTSVVETFQLPAIEFSVNFAGFVSSSAFNRINLTLANANDDFSFDEIAWSVPAPGGIALLGLAGLAGRRRRA